MPVLLYSLVLAAAFTVGVTALLQPHRRVPGFEQTLRDLELAALAYIGGNCNALQATITHERLQTMGDLPAGFNAQGARFTLNLADHPNLSWNARGGPAYLAFLAGRVPGAFQADGSYSFLPSYDITMFRAANSGYNLFAYADNDFSCALTAAGP